MKSRTMAGETVMTLHSILVHVHDAVASKPTLGVAVNLAGAHSAHLCGLHVIDAPSMPTYVQVQLPKAILDQQRKGLETRAELARAAFEEAAGAAAVEHEWRCVEGDTVDCIVEHAMSQDLVVMDQYTPEEGATVGSSHAGEVVLLAGRPVLVIPHGYEGAEVGRNVVVGWDGSREAARAVGDALPLLARADSVRVAAVNPRGGRDEGEQRAEVVAHLVRHGVPAAAEDVSSTMQVGEALVKWAADNGADLVVMGGYGRGRVREVLFGGATAYVLEHGRLPILLSH